MKTDIFVTHVVLSLVIPVARSNSIPGNLKVPMNSFYLPENNRNELLQTALTKFIKSIITLHYSDCYGIQLAPETNLDDIYNADSIPMIHISHPIKMGMIKGLFSNRDNSFIRYGKQCMVYEVILSGREDTDDLIKIFVTSELQKRAKNAHIFVNEHVNFESAKRFLLHSDLKSYQHRVWAENLNDPDTVDYGIIFHPFCFYCNNGDPGIGTTNQIFKHPEEVESLKDIFPDVTSNFYGHVMRVTAPPAPPLVIIAPSESDSTKNSISGQQKNILDSTAEKYNFTYSLYSVPGGSTGSRLPNGTWNGVMGEILYGRADIGLCVATAYDRREIADFTVSVFYAFLVLVSTKPVPVFEWQAIFYPFKTTGWIALTASTMFTLYFYQLLHNRSLPLEIPLRRKWKSKLNMLYCMKNEIMTGFRAFYMTVGSLLEQGVPIDYNTTATSRIVATFWMFFAIIITCAYRSKLFSFLISPTIVTPPSSFQELGSSDYTWGMKSLGGIALLFITQSPLQYIRKIGEQMEISTDKYTCLDNTFHGKFTCIIYRAYIDYMMAVRYWKIKHQFYISDFVTPPVGSGWALPKYSPLKRNFDEMSFRIHEMGLADKYLEDYQVSYANVARALAQASNSTKDTFDLNTNFLNDGDAGPKALEMDNLYGGFFILCCGITVSIVILIIEKIKHHKARKRRGAWQRVIHCLLASLFRN